MRIANRLVIHTACIAFFSVILTSVSIGWSSYTLGKKTIEQEAKKRLIALRESKKSEIEGYFNIIRNQLITFSNDLMIIQAMDDFKRAYVSYKTESGLGQKGVFDAKKTQYFLDAFVEKYKKENGDFEKVETMDLLNFANESSFLLQYNYIIENPYNLGEKYWLDTVNDGTQYSAFHQKYHPKIREYLQKFGFYDILLVDAETGEVVYSVHKEVDFASSLKTGIAANSGLGEVFIAANALENPGAGETAIVDFSPYLVSYNEESAFMATPVYKDKVKIGILIFQLPIGVINNIMTYNEQWKNVGLGDTGETYLVGSDYLQRSMSRFFVEAPDDYITEMRSLGSPESTLYKIQAKQSTIGLQSVNTKGARTVFENQKPGIDLYSNYKNIPVLSAYTPLKIHGLNWALMSDMAVSEAYQSVARLAVNVIILTGVTALIGVLISIMVGMMLNRRISGPILELEDKIQKITKEMDLTQKIHINSADEIGAMATALNQLIAAFRHTLQETLASTEQMELAEHELNALSESLDLNQAEQMKKVVEARKDLQDLSTKLHALSGQFKLLEEKSAAEEEW